MPRIRIIRSSPDPEDYLEDWRYEEIKREREAMEEIRRRAEDFAAAVSSYPNAWNFGDGYGGCVLQDIYDALTARGFSRFPPKPDPSDKPKRLPMSQKRRMEIFERDGFRCQRCGSQKSLQVDHIHPVSKGGTDDDDNLQTLCKSCNSSKGARI